MNEARANPEIRRNRTKRKSVRIPTFLTKFHNQAQIAELLVREYVDALNAVRRIETIDRELKDPFKKNSGIKKFILEYFHKVSSDKHRPLLQEVFFQYSREIFEIELSGFKDFADEWFKASTPRPLDLSEKQSRVFFKRKNYLRSLRQICALWQLIGAMDASIPIKKLSFKGDGELVLHRLRAHALNCRSAFVEGIVLGPKLTRHFREMFEGLQAEELAKIRKAIAQNTADKIERNSDGTFAAIHEWRTEAHSSVD